jgi:hypothetical protein
VKEVKEHKNKNSYWYVPSKAGWILNLFKVANKVRHEPVIYDIG